MENSFKLLRIFSIAFKLLAWVTLVLMAVGLVGLFVARNESGVNVTGAMVLNMAFSGVIAFLLFYALGEIIRLLLAIHDQTVSPH